MTTTDDSDAPEAIFDFADSLALISGELLRYRIKNRPTLSAEEKSGLEDLEMQLDKATAQVRADGITALGAFTETARQEVDDATSSAQATLRRIRKVGRILGIATSVLTLALAAIAGEPQGVLAAVKEVRQAIDADAA